MSIIVSIIRNKKKLITLNKHTTGSFSIKPSILGNYIKQKLFTSCLPSSFWSNNLPGNLVLLKFLPIFNIFSNIFYGSVCKYSKSNGTFCQVIEIFEDHNLVKVVLPSKTRKIMSGWNFAILGRNSKRHTRFNCLGKAGVCIISGKKSKVRGVARNPVDHPHGGRTKTNQPEVSIWG